MNQQKNVFKFQLRRKADFKPLHARSEPHSRFDSACRVNDFLQQFEIHKKNDVIL